jgi:hypothetical protein
MPHLPLPHGHRQSPKKQRLKKMTNFAGQRKVRTVAPKVAKRYDGRKLTQRSYPTYPHTRNTSAHAHFGTKQEFTDGYRKGMDGLAGNDMKATKQVRSRAGQKYMTWKGKGLRSMRNVG